MESASLSKSCLLAANSRAEPGPILHCAVIKTEFNDHNNSELG